ncbi:hypothetical protein E0500_033870 [Streptomyces sp. KM273126]|uniref:hypothetical protein n=1 Tax=Streptomyces sp. KM273126 TaxID=2545247 RepID=UPI0015EC5EDD|nr:hypothetical protein [Streptomyces sp. KM273126]MBA2812176.1 hypothetical protein [Streptomyces sp. KM273126]
MKGVRDVHEELRARLREAGEAHEPDRARILARIERGMAGEARPGRPAHPPAAGWARVVGATTAVAGLLAVGGYAVASAVKSDEPADRTVAVSPTPTPSPDAPSPPPVRPDPTPRPKSRTGSRVPPSRTLAPENSAPAQPPEKPEEPGRPDNEDGPVRTDGAVDPHSNDFWAQSNLTLGTGEELTALTVELRIALTEGVNSGGAWRTLPEQDFTLTVGEDDGFLVYRWVLKAGRTVPKGEFVFAGQYDHARGGRDASDDRYAVTATADGERYAVGGDFARGGGEDTAAGDS